MVKKFWILFGKAKQIIRVKMSGNLRQIEARLSKNGSALLNGNCHVSYAMGVMAQVKQGWTSWNLWAKKRCSFIEMYHEIYHWNMSPITHIPWYRFTFEKPSKSHHFEKVSSIFGWFTLTIETYKDILEKNTALFRCRIFHIWSVLFVHVEKSLGKLTGALGWFQSSISNGWNPPLAKQRFRFRFFSVVLTNRFGHDDPFPSVAGTLVGNNVHSLRVFGSSMRYSHGNRSRQEIYKGGFFEKLEVYEVVYEANRETFSQFSSR